MDYHSGRHASPFDTDHSTFLTSTSSTSPLAMIRFHFFAIVFCYLVGVFGLGIFVIAPVLLLFWNHWRECYDAFVWTTRLRTEYLEIKKTAHKQGESVEWLNSIVDKWYVNSCMHAYMHVYKYNNNNYQCMIICHC